MPNAARLTDKVVHNSPHCHTVHGVSPIPHPMVPHTLISNPAPTVMINNLPAATVMTMSEPCSMIGCVPNGPGMIMMGSATVIMCQQPSARMGDLVVHAGCVAPIPSPTGKVFPPCSTNVIVGG